MQCLRVLVLLLLLPPLLLVSLVFVSSRLLLCYRLLLHPSAGDDLCNANYCTLLSILPWLSQVDMDCNARLTMVATGSCLSLLAIMLLVQGVNTDRERLVVLWLYWGAAELFLKIINMFSDLTNPLNHLAWIYQLLLMLVVSLYQAKIKHKQSAKVCVKGSRPGPENGVTAVTG
eukprot:GFUD01016293.1.p1 GENE.GFUD01016293.1~~GFUD01016293.1.p1  ORF type:complete len:174 (+),score=41.80 GFUD01016293.1:242-763(+)